VFRAARVALRAAATPAIWTSRISTGRPLCRHLAAIGRSLCRTPLERQYAPPEDLVDGAIEGVIEPIAPAARHPNLQAETVLVDVSL
jgi:hypothetical protein